MNKTLGVVISLGLVNNLSLSLSLSVSVSLTNTPPSPSGPASLSVKRIPSRFGMSFVCLLWVLCVTLAKRKIRLGLSLFSLSFSSKKVILS